MLPNTPNTDLHPPAPGVCLVSRPSGSEDSKDPYPQSLNNSTDPLTSPASKRTPSSLPLENYPVRTLISEPQRTNKETEGHSRKGLGKDHPILLPSATHFILELLWVVPGGGKGLGPRLQGKSFVHCPPRKEWGNRGSGFQPWDPPQSTS